MTVWGIWARLPPACPSSAWLLFLLPSTQSNIGLLTLAALVGIGQALVFPSTTALISTQIDERHVGAGMGLAGTLDNAGKVIGPILGGVLIASA